MTTDASILERDPGSVLDALGDGTRRAILDLLADRPHAVGELAALLPVTRPAVSLHLKVLKDAHLVRDEAVGTRRIYRLDPTGLDMLRTYLDRLWAGALDRFAAAAEAAHALERAATSDEPHPGSRHDDPRHDRSPR